MYLGTLTLMGRCPKVKNSLEDYGDKLPQADRDQAKEVVDKTLRWLDSNQTAEKDEYDDQLKESQRVLSKIMAKLHQGGGGGAPQGGGGANYGNYANAGGPKVEEVD
uniref:Heat shock protein 70 n=1 Tax=Meloidogyne javanica TaxID=6303 RepID=A0A915MQS1_MELJA